jgi:endonuclease/exonuclease/phosphatase family metal-dependent hydrolase
MTFNIHHAVGTDDVLSPERIAQVIKKSGADVVGLEEVDNHYSERSDWADQAAVLSRLTGFHVTFGANIDQAPPAGSKHRIQYGTAILSRYPIVASKNIHLDGSPGEEQRGLLSATLNVHGKKVSFNTTHTSASSQHDRLSQSQQILGLIDDADPAILVGDLNAEPDDPEVQALTSVYTDTWTAAGDGGAGLTYPSEGPTKRIDFVLTTGAVEPLSSRVVDDTPEASDHLPVITRIRLT